MCHCNVPSCSKKIHSRNMCQAHYRMWMKYGDPLKRFERVTPTKCLVDKCDAKPALKSAGYCANHYYRRHKYGSPTAPARNDVKTADYIKAALSITHQDCVLWTRQKTKEGYGVARFNGKYGAAHRFVCELSNGEPPTPNHQAAHSCGNPSCYNPNHLRWLTPLQNTREKYTHGTMPAGENHFLATMTEKTALSILADFRCGETIKILAAKYGVTYGAAYMLVRGHTWKHLSRLS